MRRYETIAIIDPELSEDDRRPVLDRVEGLIPQQDGLLIETDQWGGRKLAYEIKKKVRGFYVRFDYCGTGALVNEIERFFRIDDRVLKYMTVLQDDRINIDEIKEQIAAAAAAEAAKKEQVRKAAEKPAEAPAAEAAKKAAEKPAEAPAVETVESEDNAEAVEEAATDENEPEDQPAAEEPPQDAPAEDESEKKEPAAEDAETENK